MTLWKRGLAPAHRRRLHLSRLVSSLASARTPDTRVGLAAATPQAVTSPRPSSPGPARCLPERPHLQKAPWRLEPKGALVSILGAS